MERMVDSRKTTALPRPDLTRRALLATAGVVGAGGAMSVAPSLRVGAYAAPSARVALTPDAASGPVRAASAAVATGATTRLPTDPSSLVAVLAGAALPTVQVRARNVDGWGRWVALSELSDGPGANSAEGRAARAVHASDIVHLGEADELELQVGEADYGEIEVVLVDPGTLAADAATTPAIAAAPAQAAPAFDPRGTSIASTAGPTAAAAPRPAIFTRAQWGANESWRSGSPTYDAQLNQAHVHHTVSATAYPQDQLAGILRGIYRYHTQTLGWSDIGYNFLVDRFGRKWEGRHGGIDRFVRGAHTLGFNTNSTGISAVSDYQRVHPSESVQTGIAEVAAYKLSQGIGRAHGHVTVTSGGSDRFPAGTKVGLEVIDGHRDTNQTACPGVNLYNKLSVIRARARARIGN